MKTGPVVLDYPFTRDRVAALHAGDVVSVSGGTLNAVVPAGTAVGIHVGARAARD